jgi:hypothetical protein
VKKLTGSLLISFLLLAGLITAAAAQEKSEKMMGPPRVLLIYREFLKPGKMGSSHEKTESLFVQAYARAKWPTHYFAADSLSGNPRSMFFVGYDSFAAYEKDFLATQKNPTLAAALDHAGVVDGELMTERSDAGTFVFNEQYSMRASVDIAHMRYFDIEAFHVKPGHHHEWDEAVKLVKAAYEKIPDVHWAMFEQVYGGETGTYLVFTPMQSLAEVDTSFAQGKQFQENMGAEGLKKLRELETAALVSAATHQLFQFNPRMSYPPDAWVVADPDFWKPKLAGPPAAKKSDKEPAKH